MKSTLILSTWSVIEYEVEVDHSMILRRPQGTSYLGFIRELFHYEEYRTSNIR